MRWYQQGLQFAIKLVFDCLWTQAYIIAFDIDLNISSEARPIVFLANKGLGFIDAKMSYQRVVVLLIDNLCSNDFRYKR